MTCDSHIRRARPRQGYGLGHFARTEMHVFLQGGRLTCILCSDMFLVGRGFLKKGTDPTQVGFLIKSCDDDFGVFKLLNQIGYHLLIGVGLYEKMRVRNQGLDNLHSSEPVHGMVRASSTCLDQVSEVIGHALSVFVIRGFHVGQTRPGDINSLSRTEMHVFLQRGRPLCNLGWDTFFNFHDIEDIWVSMLHQLVHNGIYNVF